MRKANYFKAERSLSENTVAFMRSFIWKKEIQLRYKKKIADIETIKASYSKLDHSILAKTKIDMAELDAQIAKLENNRDNELKANEYTLSDADKAFKKAMKEANDIIDVRTATMNWLKTYFAVEEIVGTDLVDRVTEGFGKKLDIKTLVNSNKALTWDSSNALKVLFGTLYEELCNAGTIKAHQIPDIVRDKYIQKPKKEKKEKTEKISGLTFENK